MAVINPCEMKIGHKIIDSNVEQPSKFVQVTARNKEPFF